MFAPILLLACGSGRESAPPALSVYAAASLTDVLPEVSAAWTAETGHTVRFRFESSSKLAKAIESGQPADVFFSADLAWMDHLADRDLVVGATRRNLLGNTLVAVVGQGATFVPTSARELGAAAHVAMAGENVPAGRYGRAALRSLGVWDAVAPRVVSGDDVRTALTWVATGEADVGIVYATDARAQPAVKVAFALPADSAAIVYPAAVVAASRRPVEAAQFVAFCGGDVARRLFEEAGFSRP